MRRTYHEEALRWLTHARDEFRDADELRKRGRFYLALFHFQQAAEKALKAYLLVSVKSADVLRTHSITELLHTATEMDADFRRVEMSKRLDQYYVPTRYPNGLPGGVPSRYFDDPEEAAEAAELARQVVELAAAKLEQDSAPAGPSPR
ncbi:MAG TPA: DNA-binding protein [Clostridiales bacterium]|mgnify:FL=1|nr:DNA-binding protein [Clostridiales bacterium]